MITKSRSQVLLTAIVPVSAMAGRLSSLNKWLKEIDFQEIQIIIIHDYRDQSTAKELIDIVAQINETNLMSKRNLTLIEGHFGSPGYARNAGISLATGRWITFWDSDDIPNILNISQELNSLEITCNVLIGQYMNISVNNNIVYTSNDNDLRSIALNPGMWRFIFDRASIQELLFEPTLMGEDQIFLAKYFSSSRAIAYSRKIFYVYISGNLYQATNRIESKKS